MNSTTDVLDRVVTDLDSVLSGDALAGLPDAERMDVLRVAGEAFRRVEAVVVETTASADPEFSHSFGCRGQNELLQRVLRVDVAGATRVGKVADAVRRDVSPSSGERLPARYPALREALLDGVVGVSGFLAAITPIDKAAHRFGREVLREADAALADYARGYRATERDVETDADDSDTDAAPKADAAPPATPEDLRQFALVLAMVLDPDGPEPSEHGARHQRFVTIGRLKDGLHAIRGHLLPDVAAQLQAIIDAQCNPKTDGPPMPGVQFQPIDDAWPGEPGEPGELGDPSGPESVDRRSAGQKRHDALATALGIAARHEEMPTLGGASPTLVVHVDAKDVAAGTGWARIAGSLAPVGLHVAAHTACTGSIQRVLFDEGRIVGITVTDRVFPVHQRRAILARDKECLIPGCHVPASWCEIHHVVEHSRGGPTHTDNGVALCWWHHRSLDTSGWEIRMNAGVPEIRGPAWWDPHGRWRAPRPSIPTRLTRT
ncbi:HNH endonuclease signature motif containing protein [Microbacterium sp. EST19A]|uniref:HNH endonuclease signature motif containing protein n=1 Tax=Microbacterium sp. EST19A TaxID=2862681 RepID=UPI001CBC8DB7|nr:HNH endonuclease signature motif containing protein [Microbacterium sp. EST19A]